MSWERLEHPCGEPVEDWWAVFDRARQRRKAAVRRRIGDFIALAVLVALAVMAYVVIASGAGQ